jgi:hypothetical protein
MVRRPIWVFVMLCGCGEPILKNAPKPDPGAVAGVAAAAAAAATLADPQAAGRRQEQKSKGEPDNRGVEVKETVPSDVMDRLDHRTDAGTDAAAPVQPALPPSMAPPAPSLVPPPAAIPLPPAAPRPPSP